MKNTFFKTTFIFFFALLIASCNKNLDQSSMFHGRDSKSKKGVYDTGLNSNKPVSVQIKKEYDKLSKHDTNPKKAAKKAAKELEKKKRASAKARDKNNRKRHIKIETTKGKVKTDQ
ncbi:MAG: hypothetical protein J5I47_01690 [Vicingus serpentipes]|nr:hypothetical protein [Vicingus serpentipes]